MDGDSEVPAPPPNLPAELVELLDGLDETELQAAIDYAQARRRFVHSDVTDRIEARPGEEILRVEERDGYTEVLKRLPCAEGCADCPHGPYLYHVYEEQRPEGGSRLHWTYLGRVRE